MGQTVYDLKPEIRALISEILREEYVRKETEDGLGKWPVFVGATFHGATIVGADYKEKTVTIKWEERKNA